MGETLGKGFGWAHPSGRKPRATSPATPRKPCAPPHPNFVRSAAATTASPLVAEGGPSLKDESSDEEARRMANQHTNPSLSSSSGSTRGPAAHPAPHQTWIRPKPSPRLDQRYQRPRRRPIGSRAPRRLKFSLNAAATTPSPLVGEGGLSHKSESSDEGARRMANGTPTPPSRRPRARPGDPLRIQRPIRRGYAPNPPPSLISASSARSASPSSPAPRDL